ncbi:hypothetical protein PoB_007466500 [Plakobranchus ocellatus]|uniref:Uncharacterized protein n=1 Tax=Plakobranchus ocellatus TaxID=259542 RepID=A0AAV4DVH3_9GAST|nr:hypothetical protein PoB_007466500 [Plakobranchus ocellatus]
MILITFKHFKCFELALPAKQLVESQPVNACKPMMASRSRFDIVAARSVMFSCLLLLLLPVSKISDLPVASENDKSKRNTSESGDLTMTLYVVGCCEAYMQCRIILESASS